MSSLVEISRVLDHPNALPTLPPALQHSIEGIELADSNLYDIARQVESDPALTAQLLRMVNSAYFGFGRRIGSLSEAITLLGSSTVGTLIIGAALKQSFVTTPGTDLRPFWRYSLHAATLARHFVASTRNPAAPALAFTAGLMHALGYLVMLVAKPVEMRALDREIPLAHPTRGESERARWGCAFTDVTLALAAHWGFPKRLIQLLSGLDDETLMVSEDALCCAVQLAVWRARCACLDLDDEEIKTAFPTHLAQPLQITVEGLTVQLPSQQDLLGPFSLLLH